MRLFRGAPQPGLLLDARGKRVAPEDCRAGPFRVSSPSRVNSRHGLLDDAASPLENDLARPPPVAFPRFPRAQARCRPAGGSLASASSSPRGCGASACIDSAPGGPDAAHGGGSTPAPPCARGFAARIRPPHPSESARSAPGPRELRVLSSRPCRPIGGREGNPPYTFFQAPPAHPSGAPARRPPPKSMHIETPSQNACSEMITTANKCKRLRLSPP